MENKDDLISTKETVENVTKFTDAVSKTLEGLRDKFSLQILEGESKNENLQLF